MLNKDLSKRAREIISKILYITIATVSDKGQPWNSPVYSAFDENYNFYWASWRNNIHSKNIQRNNKVFLVIYDSTAPPSTGEGVYIKAKAYELKNEKEIEKAVKLLYGREGKKPRKVSEFLGNYPRRIYKAIPEKVWVNVDGEVKGNYIDKRVEVKLI